MKKIFALVLVILVTGCKSDQNKEQEDQTAAEKTALQDPEIRESYTRGAEIYNNFCASCHLSSGEGIENAFPPVNGSNWLTEKRKETIRSIKYGLQGPIEVNGQEYNSFMPALGLSDREVTDVLNYIFYAWDNNVEKPATIQEVEAVQE